MRSFSPLVVTLLISTPIFMVDAKRAPSTKRVMRASAFQYPPLMVISGGPDNFTVSGYLVDGLTVLGDAVNIEFTYVFPDIVTTKLFGMAKSAMIQMRKNEVDIIPLPMIGTEGDDVTEVSFPYIFQNYYILYPQPKKESALLYVAKPFNVRVWVSIALSGLFLFLMLALMQFYHQKKEAHDKRLRLIVISRTATNVGSILFRNRFFFKLFTFGTWGLMLTVLFNAYTTDLISSLTAPIQNPYPHTLEGIAKRPDLFVSLERTNEITTTLLNAKSGHLKILGDSLRANQHFLTDTTTEAIRNILRNGSAFIGTRGIVFYAIIEDFKATGGQCRYVVSSPPLPRTRGFGFGFRRGGPHNREIQEMLLYFSETRVVDFSIRKIYHRTNIDGCVKPPKKKTNKMKKLTLEDLSGAFFILAVGVASSLVVFLMEQVVWRCTGSNAK